MDATALKKNFSNQIESVEKQIKEYEEGLEKAKEYRLKLQGGLETLSMLEEQSKEQEQDEII